MNSSVCYRSLIFGLRKKVCKEIFRFQLSAQSCFDLFVCDHFIFTFVSFEITRSQQVQHANADRSFDKNCFANEKWNAMAIKKYILQFFLNVKIISQEKRKRMQTKRKEIIDFRSVGWLIQLLRIESAILMDFRYIVLLYAMRESKSSECRGKRRQSSYIVQHTLQRKPRKSILEYPIFHNDTVWVCVYFVLRLLRFVCECVREWVAAVCTCVYFSILFVLFAITVSTMYHNLANNMLAH